MTKEQLETFQEVLAGMRDDCLAAYRSGDALIEAGRASAFRMALDLLHTVSRGEHGVPVAEQPSPWDSDTSGVQKDRTEVAR